MVLGRVKLCVIQGEGRSLARLTATDAALATLLAAPLVPLYPPAHPFLGKAPTIAA